MILVADSGSSRSDWMLHLPDSKPLQFRTKGLNPFFVNEKEIASVLGQVQEIIPYIKEINEVYFFGAGCTTPDRRELVSNALTEIFPNSFISVESDLVGSAYATFGNNKGLICNIGTGSDISFYNGDTLEQGVHGIGYVLGDEGSGAWFGKQLITAYLYEQMPRDLMRVFKEAHPITKDIIIKNVYQRDRPNAYLASFAEFMAANRTHPYIDNLLRNGFDEFVRTNVMTYPEFWEYECHFVGGIAYHFDLHLREVCNLHGVRIGKILKNPIEEIFHFIVNRELNVEFN
ncbi:MULTISPECIES: N-acetylglucosamine kinase [unclassified Sphingobacterium]|uniref:N-acetylglucosamine kinase n=1 Tax=unclassified Sphingobacterium TaxID=2609468 RepID=UPI00265CFAF8|nr:MULTISPECIES: N-acetylglucosamine kinase [unclassified Sphingobacterium]WKK57295.1 N-acetylglucosamine kinase [Sphingobacterium sp. BN32]